MRRSGLVRKTPLAYGTKPLRRTELRRGSCQLRSSGINPVSRKRARQERAYRPLRLAFLAAHPLCQSPANCGQQASEVQHRRGRTGDRLLDVAWWAASCRSCNDRAESDTGWALATGWLVRIESVTPETTNYREAI